MRKVLILVFVAYMVYVVWWLVRLVRGLRVPEATA